MMKCGAMVSQKDHRGRKTGRTVLCGNKAEYKFTLKTDKGNTGKRKFLVCDDCYDNAVDYFGKKGEKL